MWVKTRCIVQFPCNSLASLSNMFCNNNFTCVDSYATYVIIAYISSPHLTTTVTDMNFKTGKSAKNNSYYG